ncbi:MAG: triose-phosphate isomerase [Pseudomonadota bacterium]
MGDNTQTFRRPMLAGNWKMNGTYDQAVHLVKSLSRPLSLEDTIDRIICPPFVYLEAVGRTLVQESVDIVLGAQDCAVTANGARTGDVSASMIRDIGCGVVIIGHSERRQHHGEDATILTAKLLQAYEAGLQVILCVGETQSQRAEGQASAHVLQQIAALLPHIRVDQTTLAYEPIWAIGTGLTATPEDAETMHSNIRHYLQENLAEWSKMRILYGGSVNAGNAASLAQMPGIDGFLVGGASLDADAFVVIGQVLATAKKQKE